MFHPEQSLLLRTVGHGFCIHGFKQSWIENIQEKINSRKVLKSKFAECQELFMWHLSHIYNCCCLVAKLWPTLLKPP